ncbi:MAG: hypothetical protein JNM22_01630 [Saprospiraceae bacterium]|nr:hypothetical protein [Saprospiraceae bacterium]
MKFHASNLEYWSEGQVETVFFGNEEKNLALLMSNVPYTADHYLEWNDQSNACINAVTAIELTGDTLHVQLAPNAAAQLGETEFKVDFESDEAVFEEVLRRLQHIFQDKLLVKRTALKKKAAPQQDYSKIKYLNLEGKNLVALPEHVAEMTALETVKLSFSPKADLTAAFTLLAQLPHVKYLTLRMEGGVLPESFGQLSQLETLEISGLTRPLIFPESMGQLKKLKSLLVMSDSDVTLPESFAALTSLEELNMRVNGWQLPSKFYQLSGLTRLDFTNCQLERAPEEMAQMAAVDTVIFCSPEQRDYAQILSVVARMPNVKVLEMSVNPIPAAIGLCRQIEEFVIWGGSDAENPLQLPEEFWGLTQLRILSVNFGFLDKIPDGIGRLKSLKELSFMETSFETLPDAIGALSNLELLNIKENPLLRSLPDGLSQLTQLKDMYLNDNPNLIELPSGMEQLTQLQSLRISNWETLKNVPEGWKEMLLANG